MQEPQEYRLSVQVTIGEKTYSSGGLSIREDVALTPISFAEMAQILEAFHTLVEKYRKHG